MRGRFTSAEESGLTRTDPFDSAWIGAHTCIRTNLSLPDTFRTNTQTNISPEIPAADSDLAGGGPEGFY